MKKIISGLLVSLSLTVQIQAQSQSPYTLKTGREAILLGAGVVSYGAAYAFNKNLDPLTTDAISKLNRANVPGFDRSAIDHYSPKAAQLSDLTLGAGIGLTGLIILSVKAPYDGYQASSQMPQHGSQTDVSYPFFKSEVFTVGVMYVETMLLTNGIKSTVKNAVERTRPFAYNPGAPFDEKLDKDAQRSFYSGHASNAFATAVFAAEIFRHYHPKSKAKALVWIGSLGLATGTAVLRYEAGQHFPSDLLAGAALGSLAGWGIPKLHENRQRNGQTANRATLMVSPWSSTYASGLSLRWSISSPSFVTE